MEIVKLKPEEWEKFRELRLEALREDSESFGASYEEAVKYSDDDWKQRLVNPNDNIIIASDGGLAIGMVGAYQEKGEKLKHAAYIWGVYLGKNYRGQGIGEKLMKKLLEEIAKNEEIEKITLNVNVGQLPAIRLYKKFGFKVVGTMHKEMKVNGKYIDDYVMEKML